MVRVFIKGGVWKNSEDEILKAAVMKYGKQNWNRVASLLNRKSGKQCKARWFEWLDPSVKKVEWSRSEEEKLLHLAKLMPAQWRTIAPIVGRTAAQCQEKYELLLDAAAQAEGGDGKDEDGADTEKAQRTLRVGEIDTQPETKPARPDPIDMDEDEIEMLQEARARLANTQGKKAKRKGREKMLAEAKRLADLQKRRELKAAGILSTKAKTSVNRKKRKEIDYGVEIPFHKHAPSGFHDVEGERNKTAEIQEARMKDIDFGRVNEQNMKTRDKEREAQQKKDKERMKALEKANMTLVVQQTAKANDPLSYRARGTLSMPAPSVSDAELSNVAKISSSMMMPPPSRGSGGNEATSALLNDYTDRPLPTPMRTPSGGGSKTDTILAEAVNQRRINATTGVLHGEENPELTTGTGFNGALPTGAVENVVNDTPGGVSVASSVAGSVGSHFTNATPSRRDQFGLNRIGGNELGGAGGEGFDDTASFASFASSVRSNAREERRAAKKARFELINALNSLPAPQFEYELAAPEVEEENKGEEMELEEDMEEVEKREREIKELEKEVEFAKRTKVAKRIKELPRLGMEFKFIVGEGEDRVLREEMGLLLAHDGYKYPLENQKKRKKSTPLSDVPLSVLEAAEELLAREGESAMQSDANRMNVTVEELSEVVAKESQEGVGDMVYTPGGWVGEPKTEDIKSAYRLEYECLKGTLALVEKKVAKMEKKLKVKFGGYEKKAQGKRGEIGRIERERWQVEIDGLVFGRLREMEVGVVGGRIGGLEEEVKGLEEKQMVLQREYRELTGR